MGWGPRVHEFALMLQKVLEGDRIERIRGFATNIGGYQPTGVPCPIGRKLTLPRYCREHPEEVCCEDQCQTLRDFGSGNNELNYAQLLRRMLGVAIPGFEPHFVIDTGRNGGSEGRSSCESTCNIRGAGLGRHPTHATGFDMIDAYLWIKPPGESDGCKPRPGSGAAGNCKVTSPMCGLDDSLGSKRGEAFAPDAGKWFGAHMKQLAAHSVTGPASPALVVDVLAELRELFPTPKETAPAKATEKKTVVTKSTKTTDADTEKDALNGKAKKAGSKKHSSTSSLPSPIFVALIAGLGVSMYTLATRSKASNTSFISLATQEAEEPPRAVLEKRPVSKDTRRQIQSDRRRVAPVVLEDEESDGDDRSGSGSESEGGSSSGASSRPADEESASELSCRASAAGDGGSTVTVTDEQPTTVKDGKGDEYLVID